MTAGVDVLFRDDHLLVLNKPAGLLSVPGRGAERQDCLIARARQEIPAARIVHRLDRDTSGVILLALDAETHRELSRMFHDREVRKTYVAIVAGIIGQDEGEIDLPMRKDLDASKKTETPRHIIDHTQGKRALTRWKVIARDALPPPLAPGSTRLSSPKSAGGALRALHSQRSAKSWNPPDPPAEPGADRGRHSIPGTRLQLTPITGRSHQLRVHLNAIGHPILGDDIYAPPDIRAAAERLMLHAESLEFTDPWSAESLRFTAPCPF